MSPVSNYLAGLSSFASAASAGLSGNSSSGGIGSSLPSFSGGGLGAGTKPKALHTEFASGEANWQKPYGSNTDIVFYLVRADKGGSGVDTGASVAGEESLGMFSPGLSQNLVGSEAFSADLGLFTSEGLEAVGPTFGAASQTGFSTDIAIQTPVNQMAVWNNVTKLPEVVTGSRGLAGPMTGLNINAEVPVGKFEQTFAKLSPINSAIKNLTQFVPSSKSLRLSGPSSQKFFTDVLTKSFAPDSGIGDLVRTAEQIESSISNGSISDLSTQLALIGGGVTTAKQLVEAINKGIIGFTTESSGAEAERLGPQGYSRERVAK